MSAAERAEKLARDRARDEMRGSDSAYHRERQRRRRAKGRKGYRARMMAKASKHGASRRLRSWLERVKRALLGGREIPR